MIKKTAKWNLTYISTETVVRRRNDRIVCWIVQENCNFENERSQFSRERVFEIERVKQPANKLNYTSNIYETSVVDFVKMIRWWIIPKMPSNVFQVDFVIILLIAWKSLLFSDMWKSMEIFQIHSNTSPTYRILFVLQQAIRTCANIIQESELKLRRDSFMKSEAVEGVRENVLCLSQNSISWGFYHTTDKAWNQRTHTASNRGVKERNAFLSWLPIAEQEPKQKNERNCFSFFVMCWCDFFHLWW